MIRSLIVENEKKHSDHLINLLVKNFPDIDILAVCDKVPDGIAKVKKLNPDLLFLDVELQPYTGFDLLEQTTNMDYKVVFTTGYNKYAYRAFDFCALDYIQKPYGITQLKRAVDRYRETSGRSQNNQLESLTRNLRQTEIDNLEIYIPKKGEEIKVRLGEIICCVTGTNGIVFILKNREPVTISKTLNWAEELLSEYHFFRSHDSYLINLHHISKIVHNGEGADVILSNNNKGFVSKRKKAAFLEEVEKFNLI